MPELNPAFQVLAAAEDGQACDGSPMGHRLAVRLTKTERPLVLPSQYAIAFRVDPSDGTILVELLDVFEGHPRVPT